MKSYFLLMFLFLLAELAPAQDIVCPPRDRTAFHNKMVQIGKLQGAGDFGDTLTAIGKTFRGIPYVAKTLEVGKTESLVVNLHGLDCTTFVENVMAFGMMLREGSTRISDFIQALELIRYEDGKLNGYASRLHYFSYWIANNEKKGLLKDITGEIGGKEVVGKEVDFMGSHRELYPFLQDGENFKQILQTEKKLKQRSLCILPQHRVAANEHLIRTGDIIALTTSIKGLDVTHTGIATREADGRIHLLHASTSSMEVEISDLPLAEYLKKIKGNTGIMVARPN
jgi:hypothetical protein